MERYVVYQLRNGKTIRAQGDDIDEYMFDDHEGVLKIHLYEKDGSSSRCIHSLTNEEYHNKKMHR